MEYVLGCVKDLYAGFLGDVERLRRNGAGHVTGSESHQRRTTSTRDFIQLDIITCNYITLNISIFQYFYILVF